MGWRRCGPEEYPGRLRSREKALRTLAVLSNLGYLRYDLDRHTKKLVYEINDWVLQCSGAECMVGAVYATDGYGFLCIPRSITDRIIRLYSHAVVTQMGLEESTEPVKSRVVVFAPIYRAYISLCRNCKNCRSYIYDCRSVDMAAVIDDTEIRGPTLPVDLTNAKELFSYG